MNINTHRPTLLEDGKLIYISENMIRLLIIHVIFDYVFVKCVIVKSTIINPLDTPRIHVLHTNPPAIADNIPPLPYIEPLPPPPQ